MSLTPEFDDEEHEFNALIGVKAAGLGHPPLDVLLAFGQEVLPDEAQAQVRAHVVGCAECTMLMEGLASLPEPELTPGQHERITAALPLGAQRGRGRMAVMMAAAAVLLVCVGGGVLMARGHREVPVAQIETPVAPVVVAELEIPLAPLAPPGEDAIGLSTRGAQHSDEPARSELLPVFQAYHRADYGAAAKGFARLAVSYPKSGIAPLYLGVSELMLGQDDAAAKALAAAQSNVRGKQADDARWYAAIAAQRLHSADARRLLDGLCAERDSSYSAQSCRIAATLP